MEETKIMSENQTTGRCNKACIISHTFQLWWGRKDSMCVSNFKQIQLKIQLYGLKCGFISGCWALAEACVLPTAILLYIEFTHACYFDIFYIRIRFLH